MRCDKASPQHIPDAAGHIATVAWVVFPTSGTVGVSATRTLVLLFDQTLTD